MFLNVLMLLSRPGLLTLQLILGCKANVVYNHIFMYLNLLKVCVCSYVVAYCRPNHCTSNTTGGSKDGGLASLFLRNEEKTLTG